MLAADPNASLRVCTACGVAVAAFGRGPNGRPDASCPHCAGLERHRFLTLLLELVAPRALTTGRALLDIAPSRTTTPRLRELGGERYLSVDLDPAADRRVVDVAASLTALPLDDDTVDLMVCYHVLEHVPDDEAAMVEIARVLRPGGVAVVQVPFRPGRPTDEDPSAPVEERIRRFGQADHVRYYGEDFETRLDKAGLEVQRIRPGDVVPGSWVTLFGLAPDELVWLVHPRGSAAPLDVTDVAPGLVDLLPLVVRRVIAGTRIQQEEMAARVRSERDRAEYWRASYRKLRSRAPVRALVRASHVIRAARARIRPGARTGGASGAAPGAASGAPPRQG